MDEFVPDQCRKEVDTSMRMFKVVFIPSDASQDMVEESIAQAPERALSAMLDYAKDRFKRVKLTGADLEKYQSDLLKEHKALPASALDQLSDMTLCEVVPLLSHTDKSCYCAINLVVDDKAKSKQLPVNVRATSIAMRCGLPELQVLGDAFICRQFDNEDGFYRLDFTLADLNNELWFGALCRAARGGGKAELAVPTARQFKDAGNELFKRAEYVQAAAHYRQAIALLPSPAGADAQELKAQCLSNLSACRLKLGRFDLALREADACLAVKPNWNKAWGRRGDALKALGRREKEAAEAFAKAGLVDRA